jgi:hypothetical protein
MPPKPERHTAEFVSNGRSSDNDPLVTVKFRDFLSTRFFAEGLE